VVWTEVLGMTLEKREFPLNTQIGYFENEKDVETWLIQNRDKGYPHDYAAFIKDASIIYTPEVQEYLIRYKMQKNYNIYSYSQNFDEIPADYLDMLAWIDVCMNEALEEKQRLGRN
jgi:hypothetical protein